MQYMQIELPEAKYIRKCVNFTCWNAFTVNNTCMAAGAAMQSMYFQPKPK